MTKAKCYFCKKPVGDEFYCFGCHYHICDKCDHEQDWPPEGHTKPEQHPIRFKGKVKKMTKTEEIKHLKAALQRSRETYNALYDQRLAERKQNQEYTTNLCKTQATALNQQAQRMAEHTALLIVEAERNAAINAYKYLADRLTEKK